MVSVRVDLLLSGCYRTLKTAFLGFHSGCSVVRPSLCGLSGIVEIRLVHLSTTRQLPSFWFYHWPTESGQSKTSQS